MVDTGGGMRTRPIKRRQGPNQSANRRGHIRKFGLNDRYR